MQRYGLIGLRLKHSFSEAFFRNKFATTGLDASYCNFELPNLNSLSVLISEKQLSGFNVTIPYKEKILELLDEITEAAKSIGAVNCVKIVNQKMVGFNTDYIGFEKTFLSFISDRANAKALIFGTGGSSKAVQYCLAKNDIPFQVVSRIKGKTSCAYADLDQPLIENHKVIINTTPVGMFPQTKEILPLPYQFITPNHFCYDLIYNPEISSFLENCSKQGASIKNGLEMLHIQAEESFKIFLDK